MSSFADWTKNQNAMRLSFRAHETLCKSTPDGKQWRKFCNPPLPYYLHPLQVAMLASQHHQATPLWFRVAVLHDTLEDTSLSEDDILTATDSETLDWVRKMTNPSKDSSENRKQRKEIDRQHWASLVSNYPGLCILKMTDRRCNCSIQEMANAPTNFKKLYCEESKLLAEILRPADEISYTLLMESIAELEKRSITTEIPIINPVDNRFIDNFMLDLSSSKVRERDLYLVALRQILANQQATGKLLTPENIITNDIIKIMDNYLQFSK